ncbi:hypothetical protein BDZ45DRAFT_801014 [Acephala macrosclerotiorum]|nr:hypothetical protein BDZ45DRAFT_801014 [Acephala macrosclerotiorum]
MAPRWPEVDAFGFSIIDPMIDPMLEFPDDVRSAWFNSFADKFRYKEMMGPDNSIKTFQELNEEEVDQHRKLMESIRQYSRDPYGRFTLFPDLPIEIRRMIWIESFPDPQNARLHTYHFAEKQVRPWAPSTLQVNHESRTITLEHYFLVPCWNFTFEVSFSRDPFGQATGLLEISQARVFFFNPGHDTILIHVDSLFVRRFDLWLKTQSKEFHKKLEKVTEVEVVGVYNWLGTGGVTGSHMNGYECALQSFTSLKRLGLRALENHKGPACEYIRQFRDPLPRLLKTEKNKALIIEDFVTLFTRMKLPCGVPEISFIN